MTAPMAAHVNPLVPTETGTRSFAALDSRLGGNERREGRRETGLPAYSRQAARRLRRQLPQHVMQDAAVLEVVELVERIDAADQRHPFEPAIGRHDLRH